MKEPRRNEPTAPGVSEEAGRLLDRLIDLWRQWDDPSNEAYYLTVLAPQIAANDPAAKLRDDERQVVDQLRKSLSRSDWSKLPELIAERRLYQARTAERERLQKLEEARQAEEQLRIAAAEERRRIELARLQELEEARQAKERAQIAAAEERRRAAFLGRVRGWLERDFLGADEAVRQDVDSDVLTNDSYRALKERFVRDWAAGTLDLQLDSDQAAAVAAVHGNVQVVARAGSGKTRTLVSRAIFLQQHCGVSARSLLLLAFNKKAAEEMRGRLASALPENELPHVMTFHALAYALVHPQQELIFDDPTTDQFGVSLEVQEVIDEHIRSSEYRPKIRDLMLAHYREDWERIVDGRFQLTMDEFLDHRRSLPRESIDGKYVKSFGEKTIANALFEHGVEYRYERSHSWNGVNYRPDFSLHRAQVVIEYFGLAGDADYDAQSDAKRAYWSGREGWTLLEYTPHDLRVNGVDAFVARLLRELESLGIPTRRLEEEEIWNRVSKRALDSFSRAVSTFVARSRNRDLNPDDLRSAIERHTPASAAEATFLEVGTSVLESYLARLSREGKQDFNGLVWQAIEQVENGQSRFSRKRGTEQGDLGQIGFVLVDEFQDFSPMFFRLFNAIRRASPDVGFFGVGDDWQAINGFAGSELRFFEDFGAHFPEATTLDIRTNYRSPISVVEAGNALMNGRGLPGVARRKDEGGIDLYGLDDFRASAVEKERHGRDEITPAVLRLTKAFLDRGLDVTLLSRRNGLPWEVNYSRSLENISNGLHRFLEHLRSYLPEDDRGRLTVSTVHKFKGLERQAIIVLDAVAHSYPLIHPTWAFLRIFGDNLEKLYGDERRLFYVALTRSQDSLALITESQTRSPFLDEIQRHFALTPVAWEKVRPIPSLGGERLEIRVFDAYEVKDELKDLKYDWAAEGKYWRRTVLAEGFSTDALMTQPCKRGSVRVEVLSEAGKVVHAG